MTPFRLDLRSSTSQAMEIAAHSPGLLRGSKGYEPSGASLGAWIISAQAADPAALADAIDDIVVIFHYAVPQTAQP